MKLVVYSGEDRVFVTTKELEAAFIERATRKWAWNLDDDFDRVEIDNQDCCVEVEVRNRIVVS